MSFQISSETKLLWAMNWLYLSPISKLITHSKGTIIKLNVLGLWCILLIWWAIFIEIFSVEILLWSSLTFVLELLNIFFSIPLISSTPESDCSSFITLITSSASFSFLSFALCFFLRFWSCSMERNSDLSSSNVNCLSKIYQRHLLWLDEFPLKMRVVAFHQRSISWLLLFNCFID